MYKSIPLKNLKNSRGNGVRQVINTHHSHVPSGNYQQLPQTLSGLSSAGDFHPTPGNINISSQISINRKLNATSSNGASKSPARNPNHYSEAKTVALNSDQRNAEHSLTNHSQPRAGIQNHFKVNKKLSVQNNVSTSLVSNQVRLVSNVASVSQSQVGSIPLTSGGGQLSGKIITNGSYQRQNLHQLHSLKTRYGRKIKNSTSRTQSNND